MELLEARQGPVCGSATAVAAPIPSSHRSLFWVPGP